MTKLPISLSFLCVVSIQSYVFAGKVENSSKAYAQTHKQKENIRPTKVIVHYDAESKKKTLSDLDSCVLVTRVDDASLDPAVRPVLEPALIATKKLDFLKQKFEFF